MYRIACWAMGPSNSNGIACLEDPTDYATFYSSHLLANEPVLISSQATRSWPLFATWFTNELNEQEESERTIINWTYLMQQYGGMEHDVVDSATGEQHHRRLLQTVFDLWQSNAAAGEALYVKDLHLPLLIEQRDAAQGGSGGVQRELYDVMDLVKDDWMNSFYCKATKDDFRFVYMGGRKSDTLLHCDVYSSYSISTNLHGRKRWTLFPPHLTAQLLPLIAVAQHEDRSVDVRLWDEQVRLRFERDGMRVVLQEEGETIFVPSGWYHQVENLTQPTFSLNHNWCNSVNLPRMYAAMKHETKLVRRSIADIEQSFATRCEWQACVDELMTRSYGWSYLTFWKMILQELCFLAEESGCDPALPCSSSWPRCSSEYRPSIGFILDQIQPLLDDFLSREEEEHRLTIGLDDVLASVKEKLLSLLCFSKNAAEKGSRAADG